MTLHLQDGQKRCPNGTRRIPGTRSCKGTPKPKKSQKSPCAKPEAECRPPCKWVGGVSRQFCRSAKNKPRTSPNKPRTKPNKPRTKPRCPNGQRRIGFDCVGTPKPLKGKQSRSTEKPRKPRGPGSRAARKTVPKQIVPNHIQEIEDSDSDSDDFDYDAPLDQAYQVRS